MVTYVVIGLLVEIIRIIERYLRKLWTLEDLKDPSIIFVELGNLILSLILWPMTIILEIIEYLLTKE